MMDHRSLSKLTLHALLFLTVPAFGAEVREFYNGIRGLGMGGASVATVNDETALLINPAALGKLRDQYVTMFDPELEGGTNTQKTVGLDVLKMINPQEALNKANNHKDQNIHERFQLFPSVVVPNFGFGLLGKYVIDAKVDSTTDLFSYNLTNDIAAVLGFNLRFFGGILKIGGSARLIDRTHIGKDDIATNSTSLSISSLASTGMGVGSDAGLILTAPVAWLPTLAATYRDIGRTSYTWRDGMFLSTSTHPDSTPETVDVAIAAHPIINKRLRSTLTAQYDDVLTYSKETNQMRRLHVGYELNYSDALFFRLGMNQRYWTTGFELAIVNYQFQFAAYGEDIGTAAVPKEDRRYAIKFAIRF